MVAGLVSPDKRGEWPTLLAAVFHTIANPRNNCFYVNKVYRRIGKVHRKSRNIVPKERNKHRL